MIGIIQNPKSFSLLKRLNSYSRKIDWLVFALICLFTMGSWIDTYGIWSQMPILTQQLNEAWALSSVITVISQIGQFGPLLFLVGHWYSPQKVTFVRASYLILLVGAVSCFLLAFLWDRQLEINGQKYSIALYVLNFCLSLLDGTSTVVFLPFICENYIKEYIIPNYIGESLAAFVPGLLSLIQNFDPSSSSSSLSTGPFNNLTNSSNSSTSIQMPSEPLFSVTIFFILMSMLLIISTIALYLLLNTSIGRREQQKSVRIKRNQMSFSKNLSNLTKEETMICHQLDFVDNDNFHEHSFIENIKEAVDCHLNNEKLILFTCVLVISFVGYGILPSLQSYSVLPYGLHSYNLAVNLSLVFLPISIFLTIWSYHVSILCILIEFAISLALSVYIIFISCHSPDPPFMNDWFGSPLIILSWILTQLMFMRIRCLISTRLERFGKNYLLLNGFLTMTGQTIGAILMYILVNVFCLFKQG